MTISSPTQSPARIAAGQSVTLSFKVKSTQAASNVDAYFNIQHPGSPDVRIDVRNLTFKAGETKTISAIYTARATDRIGTKFWVAEVYQNLQLKAQLYTQRLGIVMNFEQTSGVAITAPFGSEYDNPCDAESTALYVPCSLGAITANIKALYVNDYFPDNYRVMPAGCSENGTGAICDGSSREVERSWVGSSDTLGDVASARNVTAANIIDGQLGDERTAAIIQDLNVAPNSAGDFCANLNYSGYTDWHLPSKSELALLYCRSAATKSSLFPQEMPGCSSISNYGYGLGFPGVNFYGNPNGLPFNITLGSGPTVYLSSTEADAATVWAMDFATGQQFTISKRSPAAVRCIRKTDGLKF